MSDHTCEAEAGRLPKSGLHRKLVPGQPGLQNLLETDRQTDRHTYTEIPCLLAIAIQGPKQPFMCSRLWLCYFCAFCTHQVNGLGGLDLSLNTGFEVHHTLYPPTHGGCLCLPVYLCKDTGCVPMVIMMVLNCIHVCECVFACLPECVPCACGTHRDKRRLHTWDPVIDGCEPSNVYTENQIQSSATGARDG